MESINVSLSGNTSSLSANLAPEFELDRRFDYSCCLLDLSVQIPALTATLSDAADDFFYHHYHHDHAYKAHHIQLGAGRRTLKEIAMEVEEIMRSNKHDVGLWFNEESMKYHIQTGPNVQVNFEQSKTIASIFGFEPRTIPSSSMVEADHSLGSFNVSTIRVNCDLVSGSFYNDLSTHTIHEFYPKPLSNYKLIEQPHNLIYLPVVRQRISNINVTVADQNGRPIDFEDGTLINCRFHIKRSLKRC